MSEDRLDRIETKQDSEMKEAAMFRGELRSFMSNTDSYIKAVSAKADKIDSKIDLHVSDLSAHGVAAQEKLTGKVVGWVTALGAFSGVVGAGVHWVLTHVSKG